MEVEFKLDELSAEDLILLEQISNGEVGAKEIVALLNRAVVGGAKAVPLLQLAEVMNALSTEISNVFDVKN